MEMFHLIWVGVIFTSNHYQPLEFDVPIEWNVYQEFFISIAFNKFRFVKTSLPGFEHQATRILHLV